MWPKIEKMWNTYICRIVQGGGGFGRMTMQTHSAMMEPEAGDPKTMNVAEDSEQWQCKPIVQWWNRRPAIQRPWRWRRIQKHWNIEFFNDNANTLCNDGTGGRRSKDNEGEGGFGNTNILNCSMTVQTHFAMMEPEAGNPKAMRVAGDLEQWQCKL